MTTKDIDKTKRDKGHLIIPSVMIALLIFALVRTFSWNYFEPKLMWFLFGGFTLAMTIVILFNEIKAYRAPAKEETEADPMKKKKKAVAGGKGLFFVLTWALAYLVTANLVGLLTSTALFSVAYVRFVGKRSWLRTIIFSAILLIGIYAIFVVGLQVRLYKGIFHIW